MREGAQVEQANTSAMTEVLQEIRGAWRFRWQGMGAAWVLLLAGWIAISAMPNVYEAGAKIYVDASTRLRPLLQGLAVDPNVDAQVSYVRQTLLSRPHLAKMIAATQLDARVKNERERADLIEKLKTKIDIETVRNAEQPMAGRVYTVTYQDTHRETALAVVESLVAGFVEGSQDSNREQSVEAQQFLTEQLHGLESKLSKAEDGLAEFKKQNFGLLPGQGGDYFQRVQTEQENLNHSQAQLSVLLSQREELQTQLRGEKPLVPLERPAGAAAPAGGEKDLDGRIKESESKLEDLLLRFTEKHPEVIALRQTIADLKARRVTEIAALEHGGSGSGSLSVADNPLYQAIRMQLNKIDVDVAAARGDIADRERRVRDLKRQIDSAPDVEAELARLNRDYGVTKVQYEALLDRLQKAKLSEASEETGAVKFEVTDPPAARPEPVAPKRLLMLLAVFLVAVGGGVVVAYLLHQHNPVYSTASSLSQTTRLPVFGTVSMVRLEEVASQARASVFRYGTVALGLAFAFVVVLVLKDASATWFQHILG